VWGWQCVVRASASFRHKASTHGLAPVFLALVVHMLSYARGFVSQRLPGRPPALRCLVMLLQGLCARAALTSKRCSPSNPDWGVLPYVSRIALAHAVARYSTVEGVEKANIAHAQSHKKKGRRGTAARMIKKWVPKVQTEIFIQTQQRGAHDARGLPCTA